MQNSTKMVMNHDVKSRFWHYYTTIGFWEISRLCFLLPADCKRLFCFCLLLRSTIYYVVSDQKAKKVSHVMLM